MNYVEKFKPQSVKDIIGNKKLIGELKNWIQEYGKLKNTNIQKAALISGPLGIGKSLSVELIAKELKIKRIIYYSSCCKSNPPITTKPDPNITYISKINCNRSIMLNFTNLTKNLRFSRALIFENANCLTGTTITEIKKLISKSQIPIIIICNDSYPLKSLEKVCLPIKFRRPTKIQIRKYLQKIGLIKPDANIARVEKMIEEQGNDIRHILNSIQMRISGSKDSDGKSDIFSATKDIFNKKLELEKRLDAYYEDYSMIPLMVHENYINNSLTLQSLNLTADALCEYDIVSSNTGPGSWNLLNLGGMLTIRAINMANTRVGMIKFSRILGKGSSQRSNFQKIVEIKLERLEQIPYMYFIYITKLNDCSKLKKEDKISGIEEVIKCMNFYKITRDDFIDFFPKILINPLKLDTKINGVLKKSKIFHYSQKI